MRSGFVDMCDILPCRGLRSGACTLSYDMGIPQETCGKNRKWADWQEALWQAEDDTMTPETKAPQQTTNGVATAAVPPLRPVTVPDFVAAKARGVKLTMLTAYDYTMARLLDAACVDGLLVGDSLGMVVQGNDTSLTVTLDEVTDHTKMVVRGSSGSLRWRTYRS